jgi:hypothetical protein
MTFAYGIAISKKVGPALLLQFEVEVQGQGYLARFKQELTPPTFRHAILEPLADIFVQTYSPSGQIIGLTEAFYVGKGSERGLIAGTKVVLPSPISIEYFRLEAPEHFVLDDIGEILFFFPELQTLKKRLELECNLQELMTPETFSGVEDFERGMKLKFDKAIEKVGTFALQCRSAGFVARTQEFAVFGDKGEEKYDLNHDDEPLSISVEGQVVISDEQEILALVQTEIQGSLLDLTKVSRLHARYAALIHDIKRVTSELSNVDPEGYAQLMANLDLRSQ